MRITKQQLKQLIKEELRSVLREQAPNPAQLLSQRVAALEDCLYRKKCPPPPEPKRPAETSGWEIF